MPLDPTGGQQARVLGDYLRGEHFDAAYTSDLIRARETAEPIAAGRRLTVAVEPRLREMAFGTWEGLTWPEIVQQHPELDRNAEMSPRVYTPPGGESFEDVVTRIDGVLRDIRAAHPSGARVLLVTHAGVIHAMLRLVSESDERALGVKLLPASITRFTGSGDDFRLVSVNEVAADSIPHTQA